GIVKAHFTKKKANEEAVTICTKMIQDRVNAWSKNPAPKPGVQHILEPILCRMIDEVAEEVASIQTSFQDLHFGLTGWRPTIDTDPKKDTVNRIVSIVGGILLQDVGLVFGGAGGLRGLAGTLSGYIAGAIIVAVSGMSATFALPVVLLFGLLGGVAATRIG